MAGHGGDGSKNRSTGAQGKDVYIDVPLGTVVKNSETEAVLFEIVEPEQEFILLEGGKGGLGNWNFKSVPMREKNGFYKTPPNAWIRSEKKRPRRVDCGDKIGIPTKSQATKGRAT